MEQWRHQISIGRTRVLATANENKNARREAGEGNTKQTNCTVPGYVARLISRKGEDQGNDWDMVPGNSQDWQGEQAGWCCLVKEMTSTTTRPQRR